MIEFDSERLLTISQASRRLPRNNRGKSPHPSTVWRWISCGLGGMRLEAIKVGGTTFTSVEALDRFFTQLSVGESKADEARVHEPGVEGQLEALGILPPEGVRDV